MNKNKNNIWVPEAFGHREVTRVRNAVREYDPNLDFGRNEVTGQWCIFLKRGVTQASQEVDLPVLGFEDIPHPDDALRKLHESDALRTGNEILDKITKNNEDIEARREVAAQEASAQAAEGFDWGFRQMGKAPHAKVFIPGK
jgi:glutamate synthase domain-containing protein 1